MEFSTWKLGAATLAALLGSLGCAEGSDGDDATGGAGGRANTGGTEAEGGEDGTGENAAGASGRTEEGAGGEQSAADGGEGGVGQEAQVEVLYAFANDKEDFQFEIYEPEEPYVLMADASTLVHDTGTGFDGESGRLKLTIPFSGFDQMVDLQTQVGGDGADWTGRILKARIWVESGLVDSESAMGGAYVFVKTGANWTYARGDWMNLPPSAFGQWVELPMDMDYPSEKDECTNDESDDIEACASADYTEKLYDTTEVRAIGLQVSTGQGSSDAPVPEDDTVVYIDHITLE